MTQFDFPNSPVEDQIYAPPGGPRYQWNSPVWDVVGASGASSSDDAWWETRAALVASVAGGMPISVGKTYTAGGLQYVGTGTGAIADLPGLAPLDDASPEQWKDNVAPLTTPMADAVQAAAIWAMANRRTFKARGKYLLDHSLVTPYTGFLNFDLKGAKFVAGPGSCAGAEEDLWLVEGAPVGTNSFWWDGGSFDGQAMPAGESSGHDVLYISTADSAEVVHLHVEEIYTGEDWRTAGGDSHIFVVASRADVYIGHSQGAVDLGVYHSSSSTLAPARREFFKLRGNFKKCMRAGKSTRGSRVADVEISVVDCHEGWVGSAIDVEGTNLSYRTGRVQVIAHRTRWPINDSRPNGVKYDVIATDMGAYLPAVGATPQYVSTDGRCRFQGAVNCSGSIATHGVNPDVVANGYGGGAIANFGALDMGASVGIDTVQSTGNFFFVHCTGGGRIVLERDASTENAYHCRSDIITVAILGTSSVVRQGSPTKFQSLEINGTVTGTAVTQTVTDATVGLLTKVGDFGLGAALNLGSGNDLNNLAPGFYGNNSASSVPANTPVAGALRWALVHIAASTTQAIQICGRIQGVDALYFRRNDSGTWQPWRQITLV